jgi:hypothetical protein
MEGVKYGSFLKSPHTNQKFEPAS